MQTAPSPPARLPRIGLGALFVAAGLSKLFALEATTMVLSTKNIPFAAAVGLVVGAVETSAGAMLIAGVRVQLVARLLIALVAVAAVLFHGALGLSPGAAHINAVALTFDVLVLLALVHLLRRSQR